MWNSSPAASSNNNGGGARRKGKGRASAFASSGGFDEEGALKMFEDMCDEDDCTVAGMEGEWNFEFLLTPLKDRGLCPPPSN